MAAMVSRSDIGGGAVVWLLFLARMLRLAVHLRAICGLSAANDHLVDIPLLGYRQHVID